MIDLHVPFAELCSPAPSAGEDSLELLARMVEAEVHPAGWDQQAIFGMLWSRPDGSIIWRTQPVPAPFLDRPNLGLVTMATIMEEPASRAGVAERITPDFYGWAAVFEAWELITGADATPEQIAEYNRAAKTRTVRLHPDRIETRMLYAAAVDGRFVGLSRQRNRAPQWLGAEQHRGAVPDAMRRLAEASRVALATRGWQP